MKIIERIKFKWRWRKYKNRVNVFKNGVKVQIIDETQMKVKNIYEVLWWYYKHYKYHFSKECKKLKRDNEFYKLGD